MESLRFPKVTVKSKDILRKEKSAIHNARYRYLLKYIASPTCVFLLLSLIVMVLKEKPIGSRYLRIK